MKKLFTVFILLIAYHGYSQQNYVPNVTVSTFAGSTTSGSTDGQGTAAKFYAPQGIAIDASGNVYVADDGNNEIRKITPGGLVSTFAGSTIKGSADGQGTAASFNQPKGIAVDASGNVYVADALNNEIRKITPGGLVSTFAGSTTSGKADGQGTTASFNQPNGVAVDASGNVYVADTYNQEIRKITPGGLVSTIAGSGPLSIGHTNGQGVAATFDFPTGISVDASGNVYVVDETNNEIRIITPGGSVSTFAGSTTYGATDGQGTAASFWYPTGITVDVSGNLYVADYANNLIRKITSGGLVSTLAGYSTTAGNANGQGSSASFNLPFGVAVDASGIVYVTDEENNEIRKITIGSTTTPTLNDITTSSISVFPNPAKDALNITLSDVVNGTLSISDIQGSLVLTQLVSGKQVQLSTVSLQNGIYVLNVVSDNASYVTRVVIAK
jgi:serine/threonine-protein kinase